MQRRHEEQHHELIEQKNRLTIAYRELDTLRDVEQRLTEQQRAHQEVGLSLLFVALLCCFCV